MPLHSILSTLRVYEQPVLVDKAELYIDYKVRNPFSDNDKLVRKKIRLNHLKRRFKRKADLIRECNTILNELTNKLKDGWNPFIEAKNPKSFTRLSAAIHSFFELKDDLRPDTIRTYTSFLKIFQEFMLTRYRNDLFVMQLDKAKALAFMNFIYVDKGIRSRTYNNYLLTMRIFFNWMIEQDFISLNPFATINTKSKQTKQRMFINDAQRAKIKHHLEKTDIKYLYLVLFSYYTLLRRKEITFIRVKHIDLKRKLLYVESSFTKNKKNQYVTIPQPIIDYFIRIGLNDFPANNFVFSHDFLPGVSKIEPKKISDVWLKMREELELPDNIQFMSLRDTGIRNLLRQGVPIDEVSEHARHSSLEVTNKYLKHDNVIAHEGIVNSDDF